MTQVGQRTDNPVVDRYDTGHRIACPGRLRSNDQTHMPELILECQNMATPEHPNIALVRGYLAALESGEAGEALRRFFTDDAVQIELPNALNRHGQESNIDQLVERSLRGRRLLSAQRYEIHTAIASADSVAVEALWSGVLAVPLGTLAAGAQMRAAFAMFFRFRHSRILSQRNYDCFHPW